MPRGILIRANARRSDLTCLGSSVAVGTSVITLDPAIHDHLRSGHMGSSDPGRAPQADHGSVLTLP
jgi:hypothetical protein